MGIKIFYISSIIYGIITSLGFFGIKLPPRFLYIFLIIIVFYYLLYSLMKRTESFITIIGIIITNLFVQLTGGLHSPLFFVYFLTLPIITFKEKIMNYWIIAFCLFFAEAISAIFNHELSILHLALFAAAIVIFGIIAKKKQDGEIFLRRSLTKYEGREKLFRPADFGYKVLATYLHDIDKHRDVEMPLLYFVKFVYRIFDAHTAAYFSYNDNNLVLVQGFSHSELYRPDTIVDLKSGIYRQVISERKSILIKEFAQDPEILGYYKGELKIDSVIIAPIILYEKVEGVFVIDKKNEQFTEQDKEAFDEATNSAGFLLAMSRLYKKEKDKSEYIDSIQGYAEKLHRELDRDRILSDTLQLLKVVMNCNDVSIAKISELDNCGEVLQSTYIEKNTKFSLDEGLVAAVVKYRKYIPKDDLGNGKIIILKKGIKTKNRSFVGVPVEQDDELFGVIWCEDHRKKKFSEDDAKKLKFLSSHLCLAWQRAIDHEQKLELAARDGLTELYNHRLFQEKLEEEINKNKDVLLIFFDIDHFKKVNDTYGHQAGDKVLKFLGKIIKKTGIAARYGGEEFAIILPGCSVKKGAEIAVHLKDRLKKSEIEFNQKTIKITISIGIAHYPTDAKSRVELIEKADKALYMAKDNGRDKIVVAQTMNEKGNQDEEYQVIRLSE